MKQTDVIADLIETVGLRDTLSAITRHCSEKAESLFADTEDRHKEAAQWESVIAPLDTLADSLTI